MPEILKGSRYYVGLKQSTEAVACGLALKAYVAEDADNNVIAPFKKLCSDAGITVVNIQSKKALGKIFGINVPAACAVLLK